ncbi:MAG: MFS transporter [Mangrovibacterium sp.]
MIKKKLNNFPLSPAKSDIFYGWFILFFGTFGVLMSGPGQTPGIATFTDHFIKASGIAKDQLSICYLIGTVFSSLLLTYIGKLYDRLGARWVAMLAGGLMGLMVLYLSQTDRIAQQLGIMLHLTSGDLMVTFIMLSIGFFLLRLSGQGALTLVSRNMIMKWFVARRGWVCGVSNAFVAVGFFLVPYFFDKLIQSLGWREAWIYVGAFSLFVFVFVSFVFFRDNPEDCELEPDGAMDMSYGNMELKLKEQKQFTLKEVRQTPIFWIYAIPLAMYALIVSGLVFNVDSVFEKANMLHEDAIFLFFPVAIISVIVALAGGYLSDQVRLKYILILFLGSLAVFALSLTFLKNQGAYILLILSYGVSTGLYFLLIGITWPRFFGITHLGAISGLSMSLVMFFSALGPILFRNSLMLFGSYAYATALCVVICIIGFFLAIKTKNPQEDLDN